MRWRTAASGLALACLAAAVCCALSAVASSLALLAFARFLTGVTSSAIIPLAIAWLGDNVPYDKRQATLARFLTGQTLGARVEKANVGVVAGFGMINYDRGLCSAAAILAVGEANG